MRPSLPDRTTERPPTSVAWRMRQAMWRQASRTPRCPEDPRLEGRLALVTGGARGIGLEISRGLAARGAEVVTAARGEQAGKGAAQALEARFGTPGHFLPLDLADLGSVGGALDRLEPLLGGRRLDLLVANAGLWPQRHATSAQGYEIAFATNVLGHHGLLRGAMERGLLADGARIVIVTGDIYVMARACSEDFRYRGLLGGQQAYCRSKLGNLWQVRELARRHPEVCAVAAHPGVIASELGGPNTGWVGALKRGVMLSPEHGAQTPLLACTAPGLGSGSYLHNTLGRMVLRDDDPAADGAKAAALWERLETLR